MTIHRIHRFPLLTMTAATAAFLLLGCAPGSYRTGEDAGQDDSRAGARTADDSRSRSDRDRSAGDDGERRGGVFSMFERADRHDLAEGTSIPVRLTDSVDSETASVGQDVSGTVTTNVSADGHVVVPAGSRVNGEVVTVQPAKRFGGQSMVVVRFDEIVTPGGTNIPVEGSLEAHGKKQVGKDTATIAGSAVGGAILGEVLDDKAIEGAVVGGGIGTAVASRKGQEAVISAGTEVTVRTTSSVKLQAAADL